MFVVDDVGATIAWYRATLGFDGRGHPETRPFEFGIMERDGVEVMLQRLPGYVRPRMYALRDGGVWDAYVRVEGVAALFEAVTRSGATIIEPLCDQPYGETHFIIEDLNGYVLVFAEPTRRRA